MKQGIEIVNMNKVKNDFVRFSKKKQDELFRELEMSALEVETTAKKKLTHDDHVVTGNLRSSVHVVRKGDRIPIRFDANERYVGTDVPYAEKIELLPDGGFLAYAANRQRSKFFQNIKRILDRK